MLTSVVGHSKVAVIFLQILGFNCNSLRLKKVKFDPDRVQYSKKREGRRRMGCKM